MAKDRDDELNKGAPADDDFSLEEILAEYKGAAQPREPQPRKQEKILPFPSAPPPDEAEDGPPDEAEDGPPDEPENAPPPPPKKRRLKKKPPPDQKVVDFPGEEDEPDAEAPPESTDGAETEEEGESPLQAGISKLRQKADDYAEHMFEEEGVEDDEDVRRAERYLPGVDEEDENVPLRVRRPRRVAPPAPDLPPAQLYKRYNKGLKFLRLRGILVFLLTLPLLYVTLAPFFKMLLPGLLADDYSLQIYTLAGMLGGAMLLGADVLLRGLFQLLRLQIGMDTLLTFACAATLADALTMVRLGGRDGQMPYCAVSALALALYLWGTYLKRRGQRSACRTAASAQEPYLVTLDEGKWNGKDAYAKWSGDPAGFGSQIQGPDGAERIFRVAAPLLFIAGVLFSLIASLGQKQPVHILWCLSSTLTAAASFSGLICFGMPWDALCQRLSKCGAAIAGWDGVTGAGGGMGILLSDNDLFPPGSIALNGIKVFGDFPVEKVVAYTATLVRDSGSGLDKIFHDLLRSQGAIYRRSSDFARYEGGLAAVVRGDQVLVGSAAFMHLMEIALPQGLNVKNAVFCAIEGELAGIFALNYTLHGAVRPALSALIQNRIGPVLSTRDFNIIPAMLRQRFKLPVEKMEFPSVERRTELSEPDQEHSSVLSAVLCREGLFPFSEAVVGGQRLRRAVRLSAILASVGSAVGVALCFYLTFVSSYASLSPANLLIFMSMWLVPTLLISGWVNRY